MPRVPVRHRRPRVGGDAQTRVRHQGGRPRPGGHPHRPRAQAPGPQRRRAHDPFRETPGRRRATRTAHRPAHRHPRPVQDAEGDPARRAFTLDELQGLFDYADDRVVRIRPAGRKRWLSAFRDATLFKVAYAYGLRRTEVAMLDMVDFGPNPHGPEFEEYGVCRVRFGKARRGSPPKPRSVLTVWPWTTEILQQWTYAQHFSCSLLIYRGRFRAR
jgi:hypothetical protein